MGIREDALEQAILNVINADKQRFNLGDDTCDASEPVTQLGWDEGTRISLMIAVGKQVDEEHGLTLRNNCTEAAQRIAAMMVIPATAYDVAESLISSFPARSSTNPIL